MLWPLIMVGFFSMGFISFILSKKGQALVKQAGSIPLF
jgi:hypothetical protein